MGCPDLGGARRGLSIHDILRLCDIITDERKLPGYTVEKKGVLDMIYVSKNNFDEEVLASEKPVLLDFYANWCGPCRMLAPVLVEIDREYGETYKICKVNIDEEGDLASDFGVMSIPTMVVMKNGEATNKAVGFRPKKEILAMLDDKEEPEDAEEELDEEE